MFYLLTIQYQYLETDAVETAFALQVPAQYKLKYLLTSSSEKYGNAFIGDLLYSS